MATANRGAKKSTVQLLDQERQRTSAREWRAKSIGQDVELPSGNIALIRRVDPAAFLSSGVIPDALAPIVEEAIRNGQGLPPEKETELASDPKQLVQLLEMMDRILVRAVVEPRVELPPTCISLKSGFDCDLPASDSVHIDKKLNNFHVFIEGDRDEDTLYSDEVDSDDKNFIFQFAMGGTKDLERFRKEHQESMGAISNS